MPKQIENKKKLLILSPRFPFPLDKGDKLRLFHQIKELSQTFQICLVALTDEPVEKESIETIKNFADSIHILNQGSLRSPIAILKSFISNKAIQVSYYYQSSLQNKIDLIIEREKPDLLFVQLVRMAEYTQNTSIPCFLDYMDAMSLNMDRESTYHTGFVKWIYQRERRLLVKTEVNNSNRFEGKSIISSQDKLYLENLGVKDLKVIENGVDLQYFRHEHVKDSSEEYELVFVGNMGYLPNIEAAEYLAKKIVKKEWRLLIAGSRPHKRVKKLQTENIVVSGWFPDIRKAYKSGKIMVAPIFSGAGQQNKILEAMALSQACISTTQAANAIGAVHQMHILVADTPIEFQTQIENLLKNPQLADSIGKNARIFVEENFHWNIQVQKLEKALLSIIKK